ncbi:MAG: hypothetical protein AB9873_12755 [Syntrophobacteraceae bacterium]
MEVRDQFAGQFLSRGALGGVAASVYLRSAPMLKVETSTCPAGQPFPLPRPEDVDLIKAIKVRPTHSNIIFPCPGIGGYCLPKDGGLGVWADQTLMGFEDNIFKDIRNKHSSVCLLPVADSSTGAPCRAGTKRLW